MLSITFTISPRYRPTRSQHNHTRHRSTLYRSAPNFYSHRFSLQARTTRASSSALSRNLYPPGRSRPLFKLIYGLWALGSPFHYQRSTAKYHSYEMESEGRRTIDKSMEIIDSRYREQTLQFWKKESWTKMEQAKDKKLYRNTVNRKGIGLSSIWKGIAILTRSSFVEFPWIVLNDFSEKRHGLPTHRTASTLRIQFKHLFELFNCKKINEFFILLIIL